MYISDFVYLFICPWILALLALVGSHEHAAMHMVTQISIYVYVFNFEGYISRSRIGESYGNFLFNYLRKCYTVLHDSYTILHLLRQCKSLLIFLHNHQHCYLLFFCLFILIMTIIMDMKWYQTVEHVFCAYIVLYYNIKLLKQESDSIN